MTDKQFAEVEPSEIDEVSLRVGGVRVNRAFEYGSDAKRMASQASAINAAVTALVAAARKEERERCARVCDDRSREVTAMIGTELDNVAAAIRALGE